MFVYIRAILANRKVSIALGLTCTLLGIQVLTTEVGKIKDEAETWELRGQGARTLAEAEELRLQALVAQRWSEEQAAAARAERVKVLTVNPDLADEPASMTDQVNARLAADE
jgi:hypothetical protein